MVEPSPPLRINVMTLGVMPPQRPIMGGLSRCRDLPFWGVPPVKPRTSNSHSGEEGVRVTELLATKRLWRNGESVCSEKPSRNLIPSVLSPDN